MSGAETLHAPLPALLARHSEMAERLLLPNNLAPDECESFLREVVEAGVTVPPGPGRDALRTVLFFWSGEQAFRGDRARTGDAPALAPYDPATAGASDGVEARGTVGDQAARAAIELAAEADARQSVRLAAIARQWRAGGDGRKAGYLLGDRSAIDEASRYAGRDPDIAALVEASKVALSRAENRRRTFVRAFVGTLMLALAAVAAALYISDQKAIAESQQAKADSRRAREDEEKAGQETRREQAAKHLVEVDRDALREANTNLTAFRDQTRKQVQAALDALQQGNLRPLRDVLTLLGGANRTDLEKLTVTARPDAGRPDVVAGPAGTTPQPTAHAPAGGPTCTGFIWLGGKGPDSRLYDHRDPASLKADETLTLDERGSIRLREAWPPEGRDAQSKRIGVVPQGATVTLVDAPRAFPARDNDVWGMVRVPKAYCSTVFLQYVGTPELLDGALAGLRGLGVQVPPPVEVDSAARLAEVRYFATDDLAVANQVAAALAPFNRGKPLAIVPLTNLATKPAPETMEVWLNLAPLTAA